MILLQFVVIVVRWGCFGMVKYSSARCVLAFAGIWIEKGMGLVIPGFVPTPLGSVVEYFPSATEIWVCIGVWAYGILFFSWILHLAIPIVTGKFSVQPADG